MFTEDAKQKQDTRICVECKEAFAFYICFWCGENICGGCCDYLQINPFESVSVCLCKNCQQELYK